MTTTQRFEEMINSCDLHSLQAWGEFVQALANQFGEATQFANLESETVQDSLDRALQDLLCAANRIKTASELAGEIR